MTPNLARSILWKRGDLSYKLYGYQLKLYDSLWAAIRNPACLKYVLKCSRRWGKSTVLILIAIEFAIQNPGCQIRFAAPTAKALKKITHPIMRMLIKDGPPGLKPVYRVQDQMWVIDHGDAVFSEIHMAGTDNGHAESLRGTASHLNLVDEGGFCDDLDYVVRDILTPQTLTTKGTTILASTPPRTPAHDFTLIAQECEAQGFLTKLTIHDNETLSKETIELYAREAGGFESTTWKREYLCEDVVDEELQLIPEWSDGFITETPKDQYYKFYHAYSAMDLGRVDNTALLFGYWDFKRAKLVIEDEITLNGPSWTTLTLKDAVLTKEKDLWGEKKPFRRISDNNNPHLITDLSSLHSLHFNETSKESLEAMVNEVRELAGAKQIEVHPQCKQLIGCLKYGVWDAKRKAFARSKVFGHFDHLAALVYLVRNLARNSNPIPVDYGHENHRSWLGNIDGQSRNAKTLKTALLPAGRGKIPLKHRGLS